MNNIINILEQSKKRYVSTIILLIFSDIALVYVLISIIKNIELVSLKTWLLVLFVLFFCFIQIVFYIKIKKTETHNTTIDTIVVELRQDLPKGITHLESYVNVLRRELHKIYHSTIPTDLATDAALRTGATRNAILIENLEKA